jgi:hypothetical protein
MRDLVKLAVARLLLVTLGLPQIRGLFPEDSLLLGVPDRAMDDNKIIERMRDRGQTAEQMARERIRV